MEKQIENIYIKRILYFNLYVIKGENGDILIDTGFICMKKKIKKWLDKFNIKLIILTHAHVDHIWNVAYIKKLYKCEVAIGELDFNNIDNTEIKPEPSKKCYTWWCKLMAWGMKNFVPDKFDVDILLKDNQVIDMNGIKLKIIFLPGHTDGSIGILYNDYFFVGDALVNRNKKVQIAFQNQSNEKAIKSYEKIQNLNPKIIFLGHDKEVVMGERIND